MNHIKGKQWYSYGLTGILLILGFAFAINYSYYTKAAASERGNASITISSRNVPQSKPLIIDLANQGQPKNLLQPNKHLARYTIKNESKEPLPITVIAIEFAGKITLQAGAATFEKPSNQLSRVINPGQSLRVNVTMDLSNVTPQHHLIGELQIIHDKTGAFLGLTPIHLTDSEMNYGDQSDEGHQHHQGGSK